MVVSGGPVRSGPVKATTQALKSIDTMALESLNASLDLDAIRGLDFTFSAGLGGGKSSTVRVRRRS